jgi:hypothetical protein
VVDGTVKESGHTESSRIVLDRLRGCQGRRKLDGISDALVLFHDSILFGISGKRADGALKTVIQQGRRQEQTAGVPSGYVEDLFEAENAVGDRFQRPDGGDGGGKDDRRQSTGANDS